MLKFRIVNTDPGDRLLDSSDADVITWHNPDGTVCARVLSVKDQHWLHFPGVARFHFDASKAVVTANPESTVDLNIVNDTYYRMVLPMGLQVLGTEVIHASAVLIEHKVVAFCAASGTGKSTSAFSLSKRGYLPWADDVVAFEVMDSFIKAIPLPFRIRLRPDAANFLDNKSAHLYSKSQFHSFTDTDNDPAPLAAIFVLKRLPVSNGANSHAIRLSPEEALRAVLRNAWCFSLADEERKKEMMIHYLDLIARVPIFELPFKTGLENLIPLVDQLESLAHEVLV